MSTMFAVDWKSEGEVYDGDARDVRVSLSGIKADEVTLAKQILV